MPKIRVLIVDDAVVMRKIITETLERDPDIQVVGAASNGRIALQRITQVNPDILTLDVEMPEMNGVQMLRELRKTHPNLPVIMFSTLTERGAAATLDAIALGASDYVTKPANVGSVGESIARLQADLIPKIKAHCRHLLAPARDLATFVPAVISARQAEASTPGAAAALNGRRSVAAPSPAAGRKGGVEIVCIGSSTGGPNALADLFQGMPGDFPVPIVIVQHMPPIFTALLAERLEAKSKLKFHEGREGQVIERGHVYIAPGGRHMEVARDGVNVVLRLHDGPQENSCRPAVDVLFRSVVGVYGGNVLAVVLTGMGQDGARGCEIVKERGGSTIAQDEATSVVWGMPGSVVQAGYADVVLPLGKIAEEIVDGVRARTPAAVRGSRS